MKTKNFPAKKRARQLKAQSIAVDSPVFEREVERARSIRTKRSRTSSPR